MEINQSEQSGRAFSLVYQCLALVYVVIGLLGVTWISFDYEHLYLPMVAYVTIPGIGLYLGTRSIYPALFARYKKFFKYTRTYVVVSLIPAHILLLNAITDLGGMEKRDVIKHHSALTMKVSRGGLGLLYRKRF